jgi:hypothetical protein
MDITSFRASIPSGLSARKKSADCIHTNHQEMSKKEENDCSISIPEHNMSAIHSTGIELKPHLDPSLFQMHISNDK